MGYFLGAAMVLALGIFVVAIQAEFKSPCIEYGEPIMIMMPVGKVLVPQHIQQCIRRATTTSEAP